jgi:nucleotide-binding universal stress UspA family protein
MFKKLLVCTDGSPYGDVACQYGFLMATTLKAELKGLHVSDIRMIEGPLLADISGALGAAGYYAGWPQFKNLMEAKGSAIRKVFLERARNAGMEASFTVEVGHPLHVILGQESDADLIILGQRGENEQFGHELIGSIADRVTRLATKSCLVTPGRYEPVKSILAACDGSPISEKLTAQAILLAKALNASLTVVTVADKMTTEMTHAIAATAEHFCKADGVSPRVVTRKGQAGEAILDTIAQEKCNLVVMGAHTHTRIKRWFIGCTTQRVLADSGIPALLVR